MFRIEVEKENTISLKSRNGMYPVYSGNTPVKVKKNEVTKVSLGFKLEIPKNYCGILTGCSENFFTLGGVIDSDFRGTLSQIIISSHDSVIEQNQQIGNLLIVKIFLPSIIEN